MPHGHRPVQRQRPAAQAAMPALRLLLGGRQGPGRWVGGWASGWAGGRMGGWVGREGSSRRGKGLRAGGGSAKGAIPRWVLPQTGARFRGALNPQP